MMYCVCVSYKAKKRVRQSRYTRTREVQNSSCVDVPYKFLHVLVQDIDSVWIIHPVISTVNVLNFFSPTFLPISIHKK